MFQSGAGGGAAAASAPQPPPSSGGEFTQFFNNPMSGAGGSGGGASFPMPPSTSTPVAPPKPKAADDFEELFGGVNAVQRPNPIQQPPPGAPGAGGGLTATAQFNTPVAPPASVPGVGGGMGMPPPSAGMSAPPGVAPAAAVGAGSYTQMMQAPAAPQPLLGQQPGGVKAPLPQQKKGINPMVFVGVGIFALILIAGILYLVLSGKK